MGEEIKKRKGLVLPDTITEEELIKILKVTRKPYHKLAFALGFYGCMRISEVVNLKKEDIRKDHKLLYLRQAKGHKDRHIPIPPQVMRGLEHNIPIRCGVRALQIAWNNYTEKVLGKRLNFHILRHSGITYYLTTKKWNSFEVQKLAGHSRIATTEIYTHINPQHLVSRMWE